MKRAQITTVSAGMAVLAMILKLVTDSRMSKNDFLPHMSLQFAEFIHLYYIGSSVVRSCFCRC